MRRPLLFYTLTIAAAAVLVIITELLIRRATFVEVVYETGLLNDLQQGQLSTYHEMVKFLTALATLAFAAVGGVLFHRYRDTDPPAGQRVLFVLVCVAAGMSVYFGHLSLRMLLWMLQNSFFNLSTPLLAWPLRLQLASLVAATIGLAAFVLQSVLANQPSTPRRVPIETVREHAEPHPDTSTSRLSGE
jgi:hypothetical protein